MTTTLTPDLLRDKQDWTVDDLASLPEDLRYELIDGRLVLSPFALPIHQLLSKRVGDAMETSAPAEFIVNIEQAVLIGRRSELRPDVVLIHESAVLRSPVLPADVPVVVEVVSESSRVTDREHKLKLYAEAGIEQYWIIDPLAEQITFTRFVLGPDGAYRRVLETAALVTVDEPWAITLDLPAWTTRRDRLVRAARAAG